MHIQLIQVKVVYLFAIVTFNVLFIGRVLSDEALRSNNEVKGPPPPVGGVGDGGGAGAGGGAAIGGGAGRPGGPVDVGLKGPANAGQSADVDEPEPEPEPIPRMSDHGRLESADRLVVAGDDGNGNDKSGDSSGDGVDAGQLVDSTSERTVDVGTATHQADDEQHHDSATVSNDLPIFSEFKQQKQPKPNDALGKPDAGLPVGQKGDGNGMGEQRLGDVGKSDDPSSPSSLPSSSSLSSSSSSGEDEDQVKINYNYASTDCGAKLRSANPEATNIGYLLTDNRDEYLNNPCEASKWVVVELCDPLKLRYVEVGNLELFSSLPENFTIFVSERFPAKEWQLVGEFRAKNERKLQTFSMYPGVHYEKYWKYVRLAFTSHFGTEHFCPLSQLRVYGIGTLEELDSDESDVPATSDNIPIDNGTPVSSSTTPLPPSTPSPPSEKTSVKKNDTLKPVVPDETAAESDVCKSPLRCDPSWANASDNCHMLFGPFLEPFYSRCPRRKTTPKPLTEGPAGVPTKIDWSPAAKPYPASCEFFQRILRGSAYGESICPSRLNIHCNLSTLRSRHFLVLYCSGYPPDKFIRSNGEFCNKTPEVRRKKRKKPRVKSESKRPNSAAPSSSSSSSSLPPSSSSSSSPSSPSPPPATTTAEPTKPLPPPSKGETSATPVLNVPKKDILIMRLNNRLKDLEHNVSVSSEYLEELSKRYRKGLEELQRALNLTHARLLNSSRLIDSLNKQYIERIGALNKRLDSALAAQELANERINRLEFMATGNLILIMLAIIGSVLVTNFLRSFYDRRHSSILSAGHASNGHVPGSVADLEEKSSSLSLSSSSSSSSSERHGSIWSSVFHPFSWLSTFLGVPATSKHRPVRLNRRRKRSHSVNGVPSTPPTKELNGQPPMMSYDGVINPVSEDFLQPPMDFDRFSDQCHTCRARRKGAVAHKRRSEQPSSTKAKQLFGGHQ